VRLVLREVRLPLAPFTLEVDATLTADVTALFGPSGSGKTSLLDVIAGLRRASSAFVQLDDRVLTDTRGGREVPARERRVGYVPQEGALFPHLSVRGNLLYGFRHDREPGPFTLGHVVDVLEIGTLLDRAVGRLSGGERQRVTLARALLSSPRLLLLDEPLSALDWRLKARILPYLQRARDEFRVPMIYVTHQPDEAIALCDEVIVLEQGRVVDQGPAADLIVPAGRPAYGVRTPAMPFHRVE
jgi:molybdate transport system ATP-binding protein